MSEVLNVVGLLAVLAFSVICLRIGILLLRADKGTYEVNRDRTGSMFNVLSGKVKTKRGEFRDFRVQAGVAVDSKSNRWEEQGILSDDAVDGVFKPAESKLNSL